jgi:transposase
MRQAALVHLAGAGKSDHQIADHVGVDHVTVMRWREKLQATGEIHQSTKRTGRDGRTIRPPWPFVPRGTGV